MTECNIGVGAWTSLLKRLLFLYVRTVLGYVVLDLRFDIFDPNRMYRISQSLEIILVEAADPQQRHLAKGFQWAKAVAHGLALKPLVIFSTLQPRQFLMSPHFLDYGSLSALPAKLSELRALPSPRLADFTELALAYPELMLVPGHHARHQPDTRRK